MPTISVIVPVYNVEKYLDRCVASILGQTYSDFELILVDDGSTDNCPTMCDTWKKKDSRIKVFHQKNKGVSAARNLGIEVSLGKYIMFCDSDDYVLNNWCEDLFNVIEFNPDRFICSNVCRDFDECVERQFKSEITVKSFYELYEMGLSAYTVNKIYNADIIKNYGVRFDEKVYFSEDAEFNSRYCFHCRGILYISSVGYVYCQNTDSAMNRYYNNLFELHFVAFECRLPLISKEELNKYCNAWLYQFIGLFNNVFDSRNCMNIFQKLKYNQKMINSEQFQFCVRNCTNESALTMGILNTKNYYLFFLYTKIIELRNWFGGQK